MVVENGSWFRRTIIRTRDSRAGNGETSLGDDTLITLAREKVEQAFGLMRERNIDAWLTFVRETDIVHDPALDMILDKPCTWKSAFLITADGQSRALIGEHDQESIKQAESFDVVVGYGAGMKDILLQWLDELNPATLALNYSANSEIADGLTYGMYLVLMEWLGEIGFETRVTSAESIISSLRSRKTPRELERIQRAIDIAEEIFQATAGFIKPGVSEIDIAGFMKNEVRRHGVGYSWNEHNCPAVFAGPESIQGHYAPSERIVERGHLIDIDFGVRVDGYCSDLQRCFYVLRDGEIEAPEAAKRGFAAITDGVEKARRAIKPGVLGVDIDTICRDHITGQGYANYGHALGHQVGRYAHDGTELLGPGWERYGERVKQPLEEGMIFTLEPSLKVEGFGPCAVEEMVVVTRDGCEYLSRQQQELILIG